MSGKKFQATSSKLEAVSSPLRNELQGLVEAGLGEPIAADTFDLLFSVQVDLRRRQQELVGLLDSRQITPEAYLDQLNVELQKAMAKNRRILGSDRFEAVFGEGGSEPEGLIDRETFMSATRGAFI